MACVIPMSVVANFAVRYGAKKQKVYNDANRGYLKERFGLEVVDEEGIGKVFRLETEEDIFAFLKYFTEELLGKGQEERQKIVYEGVPLEKYEGTLSEIAELREKLAVLEEKKRELQREVDRLKMELHDREAELKEALAKVEEANGELRKCRKEVKELKLQPLLKELEEKLGKEKVEELINLLNS